MWNRFAAGLCASILWSAAAQAVELDTEQLSGSYARAHTIEAPIVSAQEIAVDQIIVQGTSPSSGTMAQEDTASSLSSSWWARVLQNGGTEKLTEHGLLWTGASIFMVGFFTGWFFARRASRSRTNMWTR